MAHFIFKEGEKMNLNNILKNSGSEFPIKIGARADVKKYASRLVNGENQLLVSFEGDLFLTNGDGTYLALSGSGISEILKNLQDEISQIINRINSNEESTSRTLQTIHNSINTINETMQAHDSSISGLSSSLDELSEEINENISSVSNAIIELQESINRINVEIENLKNQGTDTPPSELPE